MPEAVGHIPHLHFRDTHWLWTLLLGVEFDYFPNDHIITTNFSPRRDQTIVVELTVEAALKSGGVVHVWLLDRFFLRGLRIVCTEEN